MKTQLRPFDDMPDSLLANPFVSDHQLTGTLCLFKFKDSPVLIIGKAYPGWCRSTNRWTSRKVVSSGPDPVTYLSHQFESYIPLLDFQVVQDGNNNNNENNNDNSKPVKPESDVNLTDDYGESFIQDIPSQAERLKEQALSLLKRSGCDRGHKL